eukprot:TRINITY_DN23656_c0_g1_i1.p1 TRINITY_DN23656_c0_g1~~TRINITY_DN23656_c0_g1_i1.p1  ORF type:complete len:204 (+),score=1.34 TRINITY_DN23656_c0_g1_i1:820-1431(+)
MGWSSTSSLTRGRQRGSGYGWRSAHGLWCGRQKFALCDPRLQWAFRIIGAEVERMRRLRRRIEGAIRMQMQPVGEAKWQKSFGRLQPAQPTAKTIAHKEPSVSLQRQQRREASASPSRHGHRLFAPGAPGPYGTPLALSCAGRAQRLGHRKQHAWPDPYLRGAHQRPGPVLCAHPGPELAGLVLLGSRRSVGEHARATTGSCD